MAGIFQEKMGKDDDTIDPDNLKSDSNYYAGYLTVNATMLRAGWGGGTYQVVSLRFDVRAL